MNLGKGVRMVSHRLQLPRYPTGATRDHSREYSSGLHRYAGQWIFASRGIGTIGVAWRRFAPPDVGIFEFNGRATRGAR